MTATHPELIAALREAADKKAATIWETARSRAEQCRGDAECATKKERARAEEDVAAYERDLDEHATARAESEARKVRMNASTALAERVYRLANEAVQRFRDEDYDALFSALAREIPAARWSRVKVNPADETRAREHFPDMEVLSEAAVTGGMAVETADGRIRISNTLQTRLERAWPGILPGLISDILKECSDYEPSA